MKEGKEEGREAMKRREGVMRKRHFLPRPRSCLQGGPKSKPLPNDQKIVLNRIKACQRD